MTQADIKTAMQAAIDYLTDHPDEAKYTDSPATARLTDPANALTVDVSGPNGAAIKTDMPTSVGGTNASASPGWYLRAAEASCVATMIAMRAAQLGIQLQSVEVTVDSQSDDWGILGIWRRRQQNRPVPAGPLSTRVGVSISAKGADSQHLAELVNWAVDHCPVTDAVRRAVPMTVEIHAG